MDTNGAALIRIGTTKLLHGPLNVALSTGLGNGSTVATVQVVNTSGVVDNASSTAPRGMRDVYVDQFDNPVSVSENGATTRYASVKPSATGSNQFGDAAFSDPAIYPDQIRVDTPGYLRLQLSAKKGEEQAGALISSYSTTGTGFAALDGYFEARILGGPGLGTWPAFWMLSASSAYNPATDVSEVDAAELYGGDTRSACHATHSYRIRKSDVAKVNCIDLQSPADDWSLEWHTYATRITAHKAVFFIDGIEVGTAPRTAAADQPMFFMLNIAAGGGWRVDLSTTFGLSQMYVDWVRVSI